ncbi:hypothetical protein N7463_001809 [Penicillium fimorum]|uniref:Uncharacterized protein n=1 Tax=Penicillium fimorum TaxID=1882269 RepID=A0A9W9XY14_9EURO|nr:hypothetical protein N7463_001809 [Penicillium fimorum]
MGGASIEKHVDYAVGSLECSMTNEQLTAKFVDQYIGILGEKRTDKASEWCWNSEEQADMGRVKDVL